MLPRVPHIMESHLSPGMLKRTTIPILGVSRGSDNPLQVQLQGLYITVWQFCLHRFFIYMPLDVPSCGWLGF